MPNFLPVERSDQGESSRSRSRQRARTEVSEHRSVWDRLSLQKIGSWLKRDEDAPSLEKMAGADNEGNKENGRPHSSGEHAAPRSNDHGGLLQRRSSRKVVPGLPRPLTFKRMNSEKRDKLLEVPLSPEQRRAASADRRESNAMKRTLSPPPVCAPSISAPDVLSPHASNPQHMHQPTIGGELGSNIPAGSRQVDFDMDEKIDYLSQPPPRSVAGDSYFERDSRRSSSVIDDQQLEDELEAKWILNLSMHFRDMSDREKFFITYAEEPNKWRRVTVSCDYRQLEPDSLEHDLKSLHYQRDKSARIYEAIRDSLLDIQFYDTVTNLKLQTSDGRLHVHVTEDVNEIIPYPAVSAVQHLSCNRFRESAIDFDSHISGFVYKVSVDGKIYIKKEIPGPDAVEEFLYEINALCALQDSNSVVKFEGIIVDERNELIKGLLISYADQGALVDLIYDYKGSDQMEWERRERWAYQIVEGLSEIHEAGFVQGDFTLSNIVIDHDDNAKIIDINRRGCPVGWEPPELARLIESGQRISIYIGVKSDLFQLGMVLWALAEQHDEPERQERPLSRSWSRHNAVPGYFKDIVRDCLSDAPKGRPAAKDLLRRFPDRTTRDGSNDSASTGVMQPTSIQRRNKQYINPTMAVDLDDISQGHERVRPGSSYSNINLPSTAYPGSSKSYIVPHASEGRTRSPGTEGSRNLNGRRGFSPYPGPNSVMSLDDSELDNELASLPASRDTRWEQVYVDGDTKLVQRGGGGELDAQDFANAEAKEICITTPPGELENSFVGSKTSDETPLSLSTVAELQPLPPPTIPNATDIESEVSNTKSVGNRASFTDRVHQLVDTSATPSGFMANAQRNSQIVNTNTLADLEREVTLDSSITSSAAPSRVGTGFSELWHRPPQHQDSGFSEVEIDLINSGGAQGLDQFPDENLNNIQEDVRVNECMWNDEKESSPAIGDGVRGSELALQPDQPHVPVMPTTTLSLAPALPTFNQPQDRIMVEKPLEEKTSNTTIRPPSIRIPEFHHGVPRAVDSEVTPAMAAPATGASSHIAKAQDDAPTESSGQERSRAKSHDHDEKTTQAPSSIKI